MARQRMLNPEFFMDEELAQVPLAARLLFAGLWCLADREGRLEDRPKRIRAETFPYEDIDVEPLLDALAYGRFIQRYEVEGKRIIQVANFLKYQKPHERETRSVLPPPPEGEPRSAQGTPWFAPDTPRCSVTKSVNESVTESETVGDTPPPAPPPRETMASVLKDAEFLAGQRAAYDGDDFEWAAMVDNWREYRSGAPPKKGGWRQCFRNEVLRQNRYLKSLGGTNGYTNGGGVIGSRGGTADTEADEGWPVGTPL